MCLPASIRGEALSNSALIRDVHNSFARSSPFVNETQRPAADGSGDDAFHFVAYTSVRGTLYELDGLQPAPISHGACAGAGDEFAAKVMEVLRRRVARYEASEIRFNLLAMVRDLRVRAREIGDGELLAREEGKRKDWQFENALRRHNFVGFAGEVLEGVVAQKLKEDTFDHWVGEATDKFKKRVGERKKGGAGSEDVEMGR
jgi:ubiquitin carboxyl-terminal hydrolase L5